MCLWMLSDNKRPLSRNSKNDVTENDPEDWDDRQMYGIGDR